MYHVQLQRRGRGSWFVCPPMSVLVCLPTCWCQGLHYHRYIVLELCVRLLWSQVTLSWKSMLWVWCVCTQSIRDGPTTTTTIFEFISRGPIFHFWGTPGWRTKCPFYTVKHRETNKDFSSDVPSNAVLVWHQMQNFFGRLWLWLWLGRPWVMISGWNGRNTVSRVLFRKRELTDFSVSSAKNLVSSLWHTNNRLRGTHWVRSPELSEPKKTHWVRCLKPYLRADFRQGDEHSNFSVRRFSEWPEPLHWIAFPVEILTKPLIHWIASPFSLKNPFFHWKLLRCIPFPKIGSEYSPKPYSPRFRISGWSVISRITEVPQDLPCKRK